MVTRDRIWDLDLRSHREGLKVPFHQVEDLELEPDGRLRICGPRPVLIFKIPESLHAPRGTYVSAWSSDRQTVLTDVALELAQGGRSDSHPLRPEAFQGQSQFLNLRSGGGEIRLHLRGGTGWIHPFELALNPVPRFAFLRNIRRLLGRRSGTGLLRKLRTGADLLRSEGASALVQRVVERGHIIGNAGSQEGDPTRDYSAWLKLYRTSCDSQWPEGDTPTIVVLLVKGASSDWEMVEATKQSLTSQGIPHDAIRIVPFPADEPPALDGGAIPPVEWLCVAACDGLFDPAFFSRIASEITADTADLLYFDSDRRSSSGRLEPDFKPDWDEQLAYQQSYVEPFLVRRRFLDVNEIDKWQFQASLFLAIVLSASRHGARIAHVDDVLFHHFAADPAQTREEITERGRLVQQHLSSLGLDSVVEQRRDVNALQVTYLVKSPPAVSVVIPTRDNLTTLPTAVRSLLSGTDYPHFDVVIVDNGSRREEVLSYLIEQEEMDSRVRVLRHDHPFNFSELINIGAEQSSGELLLLLNDDIEATEPNWLRTMVSHFARPETGVVGAKLLFPNGKIQHAGVALGVGGSVAGHIYLDLPADTAVNHGRAQLTRRISAVTGACLLTSRELFDEIGGLDSKNLKVAYNDIDYCLEAGRRGRHVLYEPRALLIHHESYSRGRDNNSVKRQRLLAETAAFTEKWGSAIYEDPFFSGNHALFSPHFRYAHPPRRRASVQRFDRDQAGLPGMREAEAGRAIQEGAP